MQPGLRKLTLGLISPFPLPEDSQPPSPAPRVSLKCMHTSHRPCPLPQSHTVPSAKAAGLTGASGKPRPSEYQQRPSCLSSALCSPPLTPASQTCHSFHFPPQQIGLEPPASCIGPGPHPAQVKLLASSTHSVLRCLASSGGPSSCPQ